MKAIVVTDQAAGTAGMKLVERPEPQAARLASLSGASPEVAADAQTYAELEARVLADGMEGVAAIRPTLRTPTGKRRNAPSSRVHVACGLTAERPLLAARCRHSERPRHSSGIGQPAQPSEGCTHQRRASATRGDSARRSTTRRSSCGSACSRAMSSSSRLGSWKSKAVDDVARRLTPTWFPQPRAMPDGISRQDSGRETSRSGNRGPAGVAQRLPAWREVCHSQVGATPTIFTQVQHQ